MKKIVDYTIVTILFIMAVIFYCCFDLENILWEKQSRNIINASQIEQNRAVDYTGQIAGDGIVSLESKEDWENALNEIDYVTVIPKSIIKTDVYSLAKWVSPYKKKRNGSSGRKLSEVRQTSLDITADYSPFYIIELEDGTKILAQMNRGIANRIKKGEAVELPLGKKIGFSAKAKNMLASICEENNVSTDYVLYTINTDWEGKNANRILLEKFAISAVLFFLVTVIVLIVVDKLFFPDEDDV